MWAATYDDRGAGMHHSHHAHHSGNLWAETVSRLWRLRRQHWEQPSVLTPFQYQQLPFSAHHHAHQQKPTDLSHQQHTCARLYYSHSQHLYHPQSSRKHAIAHPKDWTYHHTIPQHDGNQRVHGPASLQGHGPPPLCPANSRLPHRVVADKDKGRLCSMVKNGAHKEGRLQGSCAMPVQSATASIQQDCRNQGVIRTKKGMRRSSAGWIEEVLPVPPGLVTESDSKALCHMVNKHVESYVHELNQPSSTAACKDYSLLKPSPIIHAGSLYHFKPPNLGQRDFEEWMRKHRRKKMSKSGYSSNIAFGRSISSQRRKSAASATKTETKNDTSFIKCMRGKLNARREVLKAIQDYHINAEARAQLEKRASEFEQEKKERQRKKAASQKQVAVDRSSRPSLVNTLLK